MRNILSALSAALLTACTPQEPAPRAPQAPAAPLFEEAAVRTGLAHRHFSGATGDFLFAEILGSGVALLDYDGDGDLDVYLVQGELLDPARSLDDALFAPPAGQPPGNRLFRSELIETGRLAFTDVTAAAGVGVQAYGMGAAVGDIDNDGDPDLYVTNYGDNVLYRNNGDGTFTDVTAEANANAPNWSMSAAFFDLENDGDLDLYVTAYVEYALALDQRCTSASGNRDYCGPQNYRYARDYLLRNDGRGRFEDVSEAFGVADARGPGLGVTAADFDGDGFSDLFVANDGEANYAWMNRGGRFEEAGLMSGTAYNRDGTPEASMGVSAGDFDGDGDDDLFMTHLINETNTLYLNDGSGHFDDVTDRIGLGAGSKPYTGFGTAWFDYDNDGWLDLYIANGDVKVEELRAANSVYPFDQPNQLFRNREGRGFEQIGEAAGPATALSEISRGVAFGDLDNDGATDFVVSNNSGPVRLFLNRAAAGRAWVGLTLRGTASNRDAYGAKVAIERPGAPLLWRRVHADGSYLSANDPRLTVGLGDAAGAVDVRVVWPSGRRERWAELATGTRHVLVEGRGDAQKTPSP